MTDDGQVKDEQTDKVSDHGLKVEVNRDLCIGAASCVVLAPTVFELDNEGKAVVLDPSSASEQEIMEAAQSCPTGAIVIHGAAGQQVWPKT